jgi:hypothetical protein
MKREREREISGLSFEEFCMSLEEAVSGSFSFAV